MTKVLVLGDTHGSINEATYAVENASALGIDTIIQCGDFGLWDHLKDGVDFLDTLNAELMDNEAMLIWVDGNHENFDRLEWYCKYNPKNQWGQVFIRSNILYSPRGCKFKIDDKMFMTVGGAVSVDKMYRKQGTSWWAQEQLTDSDLGIILERYEASPGKIDYLFTHDCPTTAPFRGRMKNDEESQIHRQRMDKLGKAVKPGMWFHGHMHSKYDGYDFPLVNPTTTVYGLECDGMRWNWGVLDTDTDSFTWGRELEATIYYASQEDKTVDEITGPNGEWVEWKDETWLNQYGSVTLPD